MLYRELMAVCSEIHTKHINTLCGQNVQLLNVKLPVHISILSPTKLPAHISILSPTKLHIPTQNNKH
jgi:hypothetical protein